MTSPRVVNSRRPARQVAQRVRREPICARGPRPLNATRDQPEGPVHLPRTMVPALAPGFGFGGPDRPSGGPNL